MKPYIPLFGPITLLTFFNISWSMDTAGITDPQSKAMTKLDDILYPEIVTKIAQELDPLSFSRFAQTTRSTWETLSHPSIFAKTMSLAAYRYLGKIAQRINNLEVEISLYEDEKRDAPSDTTNTKKYGTGHGDSYFTSVAKKTTSPTLLNELIAAAQSKKQHHLNQAQSALLAAKRCIRSPRLPTLSKGSLYCFLSYFQACDTSIYQHFAKLSDTEQKNILPQGIAQTYNAYRAVSPDLSLLSLKETNDPFIQRTHQLIIWHKILCDIVRETKLPKYKRFQQQLEIAVKRDNYFLNFENPLSLIEIMERRGENIILALLAHYTTQETFKEG